MAKWGEGDPRWIVEERADSHNVNNWHWREADATDWSKTFLKDIFCNVGIDDSKVGQARITAVSSLEGDASACVRKGKLICIFDWEKIKLKWEGNVAGVSDKFSGTVTISGYDHDADDTDDFNISIDFNTEKTPKHPALYDLLRKSLPKKLWEAMTLYKDTLRQDFANKLTFEKQPSQNNTTPPSASANPSKLSSSNSPHNTASTTVPNNSQKPKAANSTASASVGTKISCKTITLSEKFMCSKNDIYDAFISIPKIKAWSQNSLKYSPEIKGTTNLTKDTNFELFSKNVTGTIVKCEINEKIEMKWRLKQWQQGHVSDVVLEFEQEPDGCKIKLTQKQVPAEFTNNTLEGWKRYYFEAIKRTFGYGGSMGGLF